MIIYVHGFGGSGEGSKAKILREIFKDRDFIAPSLSYVPELAINTLKELIASYLKHEDVYLIGSSLGGYYSIYLADHFNIQAILINPSINPGVTLQRSIGNAPNFYDNSSFEWNEKHLEMLKQYEVKDIKKELYCLLAKKGDELLDYKEAEDKFKGSKTIIDEGGDHSFSDIDTHIDDILDFLIWKIH